MHRMLYKVLVTSQKLGTIVPAFYTETISTGDRNVLLKRNCDREVTPPVDDIPQNHSMTQALEFSVSHSLTHQSVVLVLVLE